MHIENVNITINETKARGSFPAGFIAALFAAASLPPVADAGSDSAKPMPPAIGEVWLDQGGIYCGVARGEDGQPDHHLILALEAPAQDFNWQAAQAHAKTIEADGHKDFALPTRFESALLYANVRDKLDTDRWHWTGTQSSEHDAFNQNFDDGYQDYNGKKFEARARFVRRLVL